jgi:sugar lactone lactonase YvrE
MTTLAAHPANPTVHLLAEGPVWDAPRRRALWVDIDAGDVLTGELRGPDVRITDRLHVDDTVGAVVPADDGRLLVAGRTRLFVVGADRTPRPGPEVLPPDPRRRLNDGACDPAGRFLVGSLSRPERTPYEVLRRLGDDGTLTTLDDDLTLSNGLAWSPDGRLMYSVDSVPAVVWAREYDPATGETGPRREHLRLRDGLPDGLCADAAGNLWIAVFGAGQVRCYAPDGRHLHTVEVPAPNTTSVAFVGPALDTLLITTASVELDAERLAAHPRSGQLFTAGVGAATGVRGLPSAGWNGRGAP